MSREATTKLLESLLKRAKEEGIIEEMNSLAKYNKALAKFLLFYYTLNVIEPIRTFGGLSKKEDIFKNTRKEGISPLIILRIAKKLDIQLSNQAAWIYSKALEILDKVQALSDTCHNILSSFYKYHFKEKGGKQA